MTSAIRCYANVLYTIHNSLKTGFCENIRLVTKFCSCKMQSFSKNEEFPHGITHLGLPI